MDDNWEYIGRGVAKEIGIDPTSIEYIEAKGFLCHELLYLLGGWIEFVFTPWWRLFRRLGDILFGVFPVCRWHPPEDSILEWVGHDGQLETKVYRLTISQDDQIVFTVEYQPEPPADMSGMVFPYNVPCLRQDMFLRPPFEKNQKLISKNLRYSVHRLSVRFEPLATEEEIRKASHRDEIDKGLWEGFLQITAKDEKKSEVQ